MFSVSDNFIFCLLLTQFVNTYFELVCNFIFNIAFEDIFAYHIQYNMTL